MNLMTRAGATDYLNNHYRGIVKGDGLKDHASRGTGPKYSIVNGRACYRREDLDAWIEQQAARPVIRRRRAAAEQGATQ